MRPTKYLWIEHAERNAICNAARAGTATEGCTIFVEIMPCMDCARAVVQAMEGVCVASVVREPAHELDAVHVAFLAAVEQESELERVIEDLARAWEGRIDVQLLGPMAAYDFAGTAQPDS